HLSICYYHQDLHRGTFHSASRPDRRLHFRCVMAPSCLHGPSITSGVLSKN
ncbi:unnamed protein product, partial [Sphacelaria rigidula]